jgi:CDP-paratose 2-epimerase
VACYLAAVERIDAVTGCALNVGGGDRNVLSLLELIGLLRDKFGLAMTYAHADWRPGDQKVFVSDIARAERLLGWHPRIGKEEGVGKLVEWVRSNAGLFKGPE